jgi:hypothetical protein
MDPDLGAGTLVRTTNAAILWKLSSHYLIFTALRVLATSLPMLPIYKFSGMFGFEPRVLP